MHVEEFPSLNEFPSLKYACLIIALDNGMVNRFSKKEDVLDEMYSRVIDKFTVFQITDCDLELSKFSEEQMELACVDTENENCPIKQGSLVDHVLNAAFGG